MGTRKLLIAVVILAALSGVLWWSNKHPDWGKEKKDDAETPVLLNASQTALDRIEIQKKDAAPVTLERKAGKWSITAPEPFAADQDTVSGIANSLSPANADSVIEEKPANVAKYGLAAPALTVSIRENGGRADQLLFGGEVPGGSLVYARVSGNPKVFAVASSFKTAFDKTLNDLRDKRILNFDQNQLTRVDLMQGKSSIEFGKNAQGDWAIVQPQPYRADNFQVGELVRKLSESKMDLAAGSDDKAQQGFAAGTPVATVRLTDSSATQTLEVRKSGDDYFGKSSVVAGAHKLTADAGKEVEKSLDDFRNKKLFDFGFSDPTHLEIQGKNFVKSGSDWKLDGKVMDSAAVQALIDQLRELAANTFATEGFTTASAAISVVSNDGKRTEKVEFSKSGDGYVARRSGEPALYRLDAKALNDILEASNKLKPAAKK